MMKNSYRFPLVVGVVLTVCLAAPVTAVNSDAGTTAFSFLKINAGARAVGMGGAFTGLADDENSLYYNPAGIASMERRSFILGYHNYFVGLQSGMVGLITIIDRQHYVGAYINYLNYGTFVQTDNLGNEQGEFGGGDVLFGFTYARRYTDRVLVGITGKLIYEKIQDYSASGLAVDIGLKYRSDRDRWTAGLMIQNLGTQLSAFTDRAEKDGLPTAIRAGGSVLPRGLPIQFTGDVVIPADNDVYFALGGEYFEVRPLFIRLGWSGFGSNLRSSDSEDGLAGLAFGVGFEWKNKQFSYSYSPGADLGDSHRITLTGEI
ncbi:MAG: PorV/PorQ family protein [Candidatus Zixiibacteriota bacterium]|nr:MAG: PorV/PorQ family protein [candidate division Zixibacteria bacterium]